MIDKKCTVLLAFILTLTATDSFCFMITLTVAECTSYIVGFYAKKKKYKWKLLWSLWWRQIKTCIYLTNPNQGLIQFHWFLQSDNMEGTRNALQRNGNLWIGIVIIAWETNCNKFNTRLESSVSCWERERERERERESYHLFIDKQQW